MIEYGVREASKAGNDLGQCGHHPPASLLVVVSAPHEAGKPLKDPLLVLLLLKDIGVLANHLGAGQGGVGVGRKR